MALNSRAGVNRETRRRVEEAAERLGYAGVRRAPGRRLGVWMSPYKAADPYGAMLLQGISLASAGAGYQVVYITTVLGRYGEPVPVPDPRELDVVGIVGPIGPGMAHVARASSFPGAFVLVDAHSQFPQCPSVDNDDAGGATTAVEHLLSLGHQEIGYIGGLGAHNVLTWKSYRRALAKAGRVIRPEWTADGSWDVDSGYQAVTAMLEHGRHPTALFCSADALAYGAIHALHEHGLHVPDDVAVVAMDDVALSQHFNPPLTTVRIAIEEMGATAVRMLLGLLDGSWTGPTHVVLPNTLMLRESCVARPPDRAHRPDTSDKSNNAGNAGTVVKEIRNGAARTAERTRAVETVGAARR